MSFSSGEDAPAPGGSSVRGASAQAGDSAQRLASRSWTASLRGAAERAFPPERLLPDSQPTYVASWIYVFGALTIGAFAVIVASGVILGLKGPAWWHDTGVGHFFNSIHLWSVEIFFFTMVVHLWGKFFMAAWRGGRARTWMSGAVTFLIAIGTAFTGYVSQQNFDSQWISTQGKDAMNSVGIGAFFNVTNFGQMYTYHVLLLPLAVTILIAGHILLVRRHGVVPPMPLERMRNGALGAGARASSGLGRPSPGDSQASGGSLVQGEPRSGGEARGEGQMRGEGEERGEGQMRGGGEAGGAGDLGRGGR